MSRHLPPLSAKTPAEPVWPGLLAMMMAGALQVFLPDDLSAGPGWLPMALVAVLSTIHLVFPGDKYHWLHRASGHVSMATVTLALSYSLFHLIWDLTHRMGEAKDFLRSAFLLWGMNVIVFAAWYWFLDAGGPRMRSARDRQHDGAFLFPQMTMPEQFPNWRPQFVDYLFLAFNTSTAFSPTDVPVLSRWAKGLMMVESGLSLSTIVVVAARAINIL